MGPFLFQSSEREIIMVMRCAIPLMGAAATVVGIVVNTIYGLFHLCGDLVYVVLFPQLLCVVYVPFSNTYGSLVGYTLGLLLRLSGGI